MSSPETGASAVRSMYILPIISAERSFAHNEESNITFFEPALVRRMQDSFVHDLAQCEQVTYEAWTQRGLVMKCEGFLASLFQDQV